LAQKLGHLQPFLAALPHEYAWPTCIFWANLRPFSRRCRCRPRRRARGAAGAPAAAGAEAPAEMETAGERKEGEARGAARAVGTAAAVPRSRGAKAAGAAKAASAKAASAKAAAAVVLQTSSVCDDIAPVEGCPGLYGASITHLLCKRRRCIIPSRRCHVQCSIRVFDEYNIASYCLIFDLARVDGWIGSSGNVPSCGFRHSVMGRGHVSLLTILDTPGTPKLYELRLHTSNLPLR
jgi:hypothetical protein